MQIQSNIEDNLNISDFFLLQLEKWHGSLWWFNIALFHIIIIIIHSHLYNNSQTNIA